MQVSSQPTQFRCTQHKRLEEDDTCLTNKSLVWTLQIQYIPMQIANLFNWPSFSQWLDDSVLYWLRESASGSGFALGPGLQWNDPTTRMVKCTMCLARLNGTIYNARPAQPWVDPHTSARGFTPKTLSTRCNHYIGEVISWSRPRGGRSDATGNAPSRC